MKAAASEWQNQLRAVKELSSTSAVNKHVDVPKVSPAPVHEFKDVSISQQEKSDAKIRIAQLCPEDKSKVAKLIEQIVKYGKEKEDVKTQIEEMKLAYETQIDALKDQNKLLKAKFAKCLDMLQVYQQRVAQMQSERVSDLEPSEDEKTIQNLQNEVSRLYRIVSQQRIDTEDTQNTQTCMLYEDPNSTTRLLTSRKPLQEPQPVVATHKSSNNKSQLVLALTMELKEAERALENMISSSAHLPVVSPVAVDQQKNSSEVSLGAIGDTRMTVKILAQRQLVQSLEEQLHRVESEERLQNGAQNAVFTNQSGPFATNVDNGTYGVLGYDTGTAGNNLRSEDVQVEEQEPYGVRSASTKEDAALEEFLRSQRVRVVRGQTRSLGGQEHYKSTSDKARHVEYEDLGMEASNFTVSQVDKMNMTLGSRRSGGTSEFEMSLFELVDEMERSERR